MSGSSGPVGNHLGLAGPTFYRLRCACGARLKVQDAKPGRVCRCPRCDRRHTIPDVPAASPPAAQPTPEESAAATPSTCSACYTSIRPQEQRQTCPACGLIFHADCWHENLGCSAYGCSQVNVLKTGPDLTIPSVAAGENLESAMVHALPVPLEQPGMPWHFLFLALSLLSGLLGLLAYGLPSLLVGAAALFYTLAASASRQVVWLVPALVLSFLGFLLGVVVSVLFYR